MNFITKPLFMVVASLMMVACASLSATTPPDAKNSLFGSGVVDVATTETLTVPVWYHVPEAADRKRAPIVIIMHGTNRDADRYRDEWRPLADRHGFILIVPEFSRADWPGSRGYNLGNVGSADQPKPRELWAYSQIEPVFDSMKRTLGNNRQGYGIYGHSAGSQFVHRFIFHIPNNRAERIISANAGWYTLPDFDEPWPYGLEGSVVSEAEIDAALEDPITVLLGDQDNDPNHESLRRTPEAMRQGPHRFARGHYFYDLARERAAAHDLDFGWRLQIVEGARHSNAQMSKAAAPLFAADYEKE